MYARIWVRRRVKNMLGKLLIALMLMLSVASATVPEMTTETLGPYFISVPSALDGRAVTHGPEHGLTSEGLKSSHYYVILNGVPYGDYPPTTIINVYNTPGLDNATDTEDELRAEMIENGCDPLMIITEAMTIDNHPAVVGSSKNAECGPKQLFYMGSYALSNDTSVSFSIWGDWTEISLLRDNLHVALTK